MTEKLEYKLIFNSDVGLNLLEKIKEFGIIVNSDYTKLECIDKKIDKWG